MLDTWIRVSPLHLIDELLEIAGGKSEEAPPDHGDDKRDKSQSVMKMRKREMLQTIYWKRSMRNDQDLLTIISIAAS